jgi:hypothetical protein
LQRYFSAFYCERRVFSLSGEKDKRGSENMSFDQQKVTEVTLLSFPSHRWPGTRCHFVGIGRNVVPLGVPTGEADIPEFGQLVGGTVVIVCSQLGQGSGMSLHPFEADGGGEKRETEE